MLEGRECWRGEGVSRKGVRGERDGRRMEGGKDGGRED